MQHKCRYCTNAIDNEQVSITIPWVACRFFNNYQSTIRGEIHMSLGDRLTERQHRVYQYIRDKIRSRGYAPTVREIGEEFSINSPNGVMCHLRALEKKGLICRQRNKSRAIELAMEPVQIAQEEMVQGLPLVGEIAAGSLREAIEQNETIDFATFFRRGDDVVLRVRGDSMIEDQIADGDYVIVRKQSTASNGDIVIAITDEGDATLKRWYVEPDRIRLEPANSSMQPIYVRNAQVYGVVTGVVRRL